MVSATAGCRIGVQTAGKPLCSELAGRGRVLWCCWSDAALLTKRSRNGNRLAAPARTCSVLRALLQTTQHEPGTSSRKSPFLAVPGLHTRF